MKFKIKNSIKEAYTVEEALDNVQQVELNGAIYDAVSNAIFDSGYLDIDEKNVRTAFDRFMKKFFLDESINDELKEDYADNCATNVVTKLYDMYPELSFTDERELDDNKIELRFDDLQILKRNNKYNALCDFLDKLGLEYKDRGSRLYIIAPEDEYYESLNEGRWDDININDWASEMTRMAYRIHHSGKKMLETHSEAREDIISTLKSCRNIIVDLLSLYNESLNEATRLDIIKDNKKKYSELEKEISKMPNGLEKDVAKELGLRWIKGRDWLGGLSDSVANKVYQKLMDKYDCDFEVIYDMFTKNFIDKALHENLKMPKTLFDAEASVINGKEEEFFDAVLDVLDTISDVEELNDFYDEIQNYGYPVEMEDRINSAFDDVKNDIIEYSSLMEDTIKQNGKWVNKGKEGTHGSFKTKEAAGAQRKAMFANGYKEELKEAEEQRYYALVYYSPGDGETGIYGDKFFIEDVKQFSSKDEAEKYFRSIYDFDDDSLFVREATKKEFDEYQAGYYDDYADYDYVDGDVIINDNLNEQVDSDSHVEEHSSELENNDEDYVDEENMSSLYYIANVDE